MPDGRAHRPVPGPGIACIAVLLASSGAAGLLYQTAWFRLFRSVFGASTAAHAAVVACFLGGLGLGARFLGPRADRAPSPLRFYAVLEAVAASAALLSPVWLGVLEGPYHAIVTGFGLETAGRTWLRLCIAVIVLGPPTFAMGGALPAAIRAAERDDDTARRRASVVYGANTVGAVLGACLATLVLLERLGTRRTLWLGCAIGCVAAAAAWWLGRRDRVAQPSSELPSGRSSVGAPEGRAHPRWAQAGAAVAGLAFGLLELVWYRMLAPLLGGSTYTFGIILGLALAGVGVGGLAYGAFAGRGRPTLAALALVSATQAAAVIAPFAAGDRIALLALATRGFGDGGFDRLVLVWTMIAALVVLAPSLVAGYQLPMLLGLAGRGSRDAGRQSGDVFGWNAAGNLVGALLGGLVLIPGLGALASWRCAAWLLASGSVAAAAGALGSGERARALLAALALAGCASLLGLTTGPTAAWRHQPIGVGWVPRSFPGAVARHDYLNAVRREIAWQADGRESMIGIGTRDGEALLVNGKSDGNLRTDAPTQIMTGLVLAARHPAPRLALVVGLGTGSTAGWLAEVPGIERVDVLELEPKVAELVRRGALVNRDVLANPRVRVIYGDARERIDELADRYDVIFSEPSNPYRAGVSSLFTREFFSSVASRLAPGGIFAQWLQIYDVDAATVSSVYATFASVFADAETWESQVETDLFLIGSQTPVPHDSTRLRTRLAAEPFRGALRHVWGVDGVAGFYTGFVGSPRLARSVAATAGAQVETDDRNGLEFALARTLGRHDLFHIADLRALAEASDTARPESGVPDIDWREVRELRQARGLFEEAGPVGEKIADASSSEEARRRARAAYAQGDLANAARIWFSGALVGADGFVLPPADLLMVAELLSSMARADASAAIDALAPEWPAAAACLRTERAAAQQDRDAVARSGLDAVRALRSDPWVPRPLALRTLAALYARAEPDPGFARELYEALGQPFAVRILDDTRITLRAQLGLQIDPASLCADALAPLEPWPPWNATFLGARRTCYAKAGGSLAARAESDWLELASELSADGVRAH